MKRLVPTLSVIILDTDLVTAELRYSFAILLHNGTNFPTLDIVHQKAGNLDAISAETNMGISQM